MERNVYDVLTERGYIEQATHPDETRELLGKEKVTFYIGFDETHRRMPAFASDRITSLADIAMYTDGEDVPLSKVLENMKALEDGKVSSVNFKKASGDELREYFAKVLPEFDRERVHNSDIKKLIQWYNILIVNGVTDFENELQPTPGVNIDDRKEA